MEIRDRLAIISYFFTRPYFPFNAIYGAEDFREGILISERVAKYYLSQPDIFELKAICGKSLYFGPLFQESQYIKRTLNKEKQTLYVATRKVNCSEPLFFFG